jgi:transcriptional regulator GlxA family with amidase domain
MTTVAVTAPMDCASINSAGLMDALVKTDRVWRLTRDPADQGIFQIRLVGLDDRPIACRDGIKLQPHATAAGIDPPELVIIPGLDEDLEPSFKRNRAWVPWIARWHAAGSRIATACTGAFLAADAGVMDGREATTHWVAADAFRRRFPRVRLKPDRLIVDAGDVISSGGATTFLTLVIYLTERFGGHDRAVLASKMLLVDGERRSQLPYLATGLHRDHDDQLVHTVQSRIHAHLHQDVTVRELAAHAHVSVRTLDRRFKTATGQTPHGYLRTVRIDTAKRLLEATVDPVDQVRARAGYADPTAFRRAFTQATGLSPRAYREKFGPRPPRADAG